MRLRSTVFSRDTHLRLWACLSCSLVVFGVYKPWIQVSGFGFSYSGVDLGNHGWEVLAAAAATAAVHILVRHRSIVSAVTAISGAVATALALYDHHHASSLVDHYESFSGRVIRIGWGLDFTIAASISLLLAGVALLWLGAPGRRRGGVPFRVTYVALFALALASLAALSEIGLVNWSFRIVITAVIGGIAIYRYRRGELDRRLAVVILVTYALLISAMFLSRPLDWAPITAAGIWILLALYRQEVWRRFARRRAKSEPA